jgi:hypothetical protein
MVNGKESNYGTIADSPVSQEPPDFVGFLLTHMEDLVGKTRTHPAHEETTFTIEGREISFEAWTYEYPGYGMVTRYVGYPDGEK